MVAILITSLFRDVTSLLHPARLYYTALLRRNRRTFLNGQATLRFVVLPSSTYLFTVGVVGFYFHFITLKHTLQSVGLLWTRDRPVAETST
jgi:hypothetical protein